MPPGRPTKYKAEFVAQAKKLCELGATDIELADFFEIDISTLYRWKAEHKPFCEAIKTSKDIADERVERSLYARANGYEHDEVDIRVINNEIVQTPIRKFYPPDSTAAIFWLKNRRSQEWREKAETTVKGDPDNPLNVNHTHSISDETRRTLQELAGD